MEPTECPICHSGPMEPQAQVLMAMSYGIVPFNVWRCKSGKCSDTYVFVRPAGATDDTAKLQSVAD